MSDNHEIRLDTFGGLVDRGYGISVYCAKCNDHRQFDLSTQPRESTFVGKKFRCEICKQPGQMTLKVPMC